MPFTKKELEEDWGVKVKDIDNIYFTMYITIISLICFVILIMLSNIFNSTIQ
jgi:hypothetical protein